MENNFNPQSENEDFTSKGRVSNSGNPAQEASESNRDISKVDQQEGEMNHGTTSADQDLFANKDQRKEP
ncbi:hypothetical protein SAMN05444008_10491 [Cnuella takakiae]|uniref:Uncharacterized protein n=1 Tax=Cnuella takakiae TaxID=1302690 RepID=A0A1M4XYJ5_9BACT|nr:hypothetical protein [Cnuella takakiae]OLY92991.1 hypothetical protein BUE76_14630 [Cnuella takakiae]SHE98627.1 hypothetical protein SAMN05444008_10491 [Cnuella takakiae]